jgi:hypothetical protein
VAVKSNWYDHRRGWEETSKGWYEKVIYVADPPDTINRYYEILEWMYEKLDNCEKHCRWMYSGNYLRFKFRYERHYTWFNLRWG